MPSTPPAPGNDPADAYRALAHRSPDGLLALDQGNRVILANPAAAAWLGQPAEALAGADAAELFLAEDRPMVRHFLAGEAVPAGPAGVHRPGIDVRAPSGRWLEARLAPLDGGGRLLRLADMDARKREEQARLEHARGSGEQLDAILRGIRDAVLVMDVQGRFVYANDAAAHALDLASASELLSLPPAQLAGHVQVLDADGEPLRPEDMPSRMALAGRAVDGLVLRYRHLRTGREVWHSVRSSLIRGEGGRADLVVSTSTDITAARAARLALEETENRLRRLAEADILGVYYGRDETITWANDAFLRMLGYDRADLEAGRLRWAELTVPEHRERDARARAEYLETGRCAPFEKEYFRRDGSRAPVLTAAAALDRTRVEWVGFALDLGALKRAEAELEVSREQRNAILEGVDYAITAQDPEGRLVFANAAAARLLGFPDAEALLRTPLPEVLARFRMLDDAGRPMSLEGLPNRRALRGEAAAGAVLRYRDLDSGEERWSLVKAASLRGPDGEVRLAINFIQDITEMKRAELELRRSQDQLTAILGSVGEAVFLVDPRGYPLFVNEAAARMLDFPTAGTLLEAMRGPLGAQLWREVRILDEAGQPMPMERTPGHQALLGREAPPALLRYQFPGKRERWVVARGKPVRDEEGNLRFALSISQDITELREKEEQLRQGQKMEAIGRLAGGVAHDFNNLLTAINGYADLALAAEGLDPSLAECLREIRKSGERAAALTGQLLAYSRKQVTQPRPLKLNEVVADMDRMLRRLIGEDIELRADLAPDLGVVRADPGQLQQVLLNLALNARDAMPGGGTLTIATANADLPAPDGPADAAPGPYARLTVTDTGAGMAQDVLARIFEPFFTTKDPGKGTGLGLSSVYGVVKQAGGAIGVRSQPGRGSAFSVYLPLAREAEGERAKTGRIPVLATGRETVLLAEDEEAVRKYIRTILEAQGYTVIEATDGEAALEALAAHPQVRLLLTDVVMPRLNGGRLAARARAARPDLRVVFMSGYADHNILGGEPLDPDAPFLPKPFAASQLAQKVREALDQEPVS